MATHHYDLGQPMPPDCRGGALAIGNFDGVHRGHQTLIAEVVRQAGLIGGPAVVLTFDPHPTQLLRPDSFQPLLTPPDHRAELLHRYGVDHVVMVRTSPSLLQLSAAEFFERIVVAGLQTKAVVEGFNFGFGRNREGTLEVLQELGRAAGIPVALLPAVEVDGRPVSTSRVRDDLLAGAVERAAMLLGRPYRLFGVVGLGQRRGQTLGFPTANLGRVANLVPGNGVYAVAVEVDGHRWPGAANVGPNPTFGEQDRKVEVHLLGFDGDLYDKPLALDFVARIRDTRPFTGPDELVRQIRADVAQVRALLERDHL
ncbi:MAG: bifunctional riboflavin kinase/FAD synthetase [Gemmataceae bacterium]|nr:bifunctional riboflavin kinase/FAD synthetase [Gemmataceae bacterium]